MAKSKNSKSGSPTKPESSAQNSTQNSAQNSTQATDCKDSKTSHSKSSK